MLGVINRILLAATALPLVAVGISLPASAETVARSGPIAGAVIARKSDEEIRFIDVSDWRSVDLKQDLVSGDVLRTNGNGQLAILFSDRTQIRLGRNSSLVVKQITSGTNADTVLELQSGSIWARAERGGAAVSVETSAATAAIRGTDWTMTVDGSKTSLTVLEGEVEFSNPHGSLQVKQGQAAAATLGQAPHRVTIVESDDREQMLFYLQPRDAFLNMRTSPEPVAKLRADADRIAALPANNRTAEEWLTLAESQLALEGQQKARETLVILRGKSLSPAQRARIGLIEAVIAASERRYADAATLFAKVEPRLDKQRRSIALYGGYYARSLANPDKTISLPRPTGDVSEVFLRAYAVGFLQDTKAAIKVLAEAERRFGDRAEIPAYRAWLAMFLNDRAQVKEALDRALALDPREPVALEVRAHYRAGIEGNSDGAISDVQQIIGITPGSASAWNLLGTLQSDRGGNREAEAAYLKAVELEPDSPVVLINLALFYLDTGRMDAAKRAIDKAVELDPSLGPGLIVRGMYHLQSGEVDKAIEDLLAGTVADPSYSQGQLLLAAAHFEKGDRVPGMQALDNADRLDDNDPAIAAMRTAIAIDNYDSVGAIRSAQDYVKRARARGGQYSALGANQDAGSSLNGAFRFQGMNAWAEYYSDSVFDPFSGTSYIDQTVRGSTDIFANDFAYGTDLFNNSFNDRTFSSLLQGLMLEPHVIASRTLTPELLSRPFIESSIGGGFTYGGSDMGYTTEAEVQGYNNRPFPVSFYSNLSWETVPDNRTIASNGQLDTDKRVRQGIAYVTANPTPYDRVISYFNGSKDHFTDDRLTTPTTGGASFKGQSLTTETYNAGLGWSHTVEYQNVINAALLFSASNINSRDDTIIIDGTPALVQNDSRLSDYRERYYIAALNHTVATGDLTWRYGIEGGVSQTRTHQSYIDWMTPGSTVSSSSSATSGLVRAYVDVLHEITPDIKAEYALFGTSISGGGTDTQRLDPRAGIAWSFADGQSLRAGFMRDGLDTTVPTLSPIGIVNLQPNQTSTDESGYTDTLAVRWDAEWTPDFFTAVEFQHQEAKNLQIEVPLTATPFTTGEGRIDRAAVSANYLIGHGFGLSSKIAYADTKDTDPSSPLFGDALPYVPDWTGQVALTWVNEANVKATLAANYIGKRVDEANVELGESWTLDAALTWEPFGKHIELDLAAYNLLNEDTELTAGIPGWGRSFKGSLKVRF